MAGSRQQNIKYTLSTGAIERITPSKEAVCLCDELSKGNISVDAAIIATKEKCGLNKDNLSTLNVNEDVKFLHNHILILEHKILLLQIDNNNLRQECEWYKNNDTKSYNE